MISFRINVNMGRNFYFHGDGRLKDEELWTIRAHDRQDGNYFRQGGEVAAIDVGGASDPKRGSNVYGTTCRGSGWPWSEQHVEEGTPPDDRILSDGRHGLRVDYGASRKTSPTKTNQDRDETS